MDLESTIVWLKEGGRLKWAEWTSPVGILSEKNRDRVISVTLMPFFGLMLIGVLAGSVASFVLKQRVMTVILLVLIIVMMGSWGWSSRKENKVGANGVMGGEQAEEKTLVPPSEIRWEEQDEKRGISETEMAKVLQGVDSLSDDEKKELTQTDKINVALLYYYSGAVNQYQQWMREARAMDPNDKIFR